MPYIMIIANIDLEYTLYTIYSYDEYNQDNLSSMYIFNNIYFMWYDTAMCINWFIDGILVIILRYYIYHHYGKYWLTMYIACYIFIWWVQPGQCIIHVYIWQHIFHEVWHGYVHQLIYWLYIGNYTKILHISSLKQILT